MLVIDAFPFDVAASVDTDGDGMPDAWNDGATEDDILDSGLMLDDDDDNDGFTDEEELANGSDPVNATSTPYVHRSRMPFVAAYQLMQERRQAPAGPFGFEFSADFESSDSSASTLGDGWMAYGEAIDDNGDAIYVYNNGEPFDAPNGTGNIANIESGDEAGPDQGQQWLNVFSDYANGDHADGVTISINVIKMFTVQPTDTGDYELVFDYKIPLSGETGITAPSTAQAFVMLVDFNGDGNGTDLGMYDTTYGSVSSWEEGRVAFSIDGDVDAGMTIVIGFNNEASNYDPSSVFYDNVRVIRAE